MPDRRRHRGPHPEDQQRFAPLHLTILVRAAAELAWLLERGYPGAASLQLVGNRHELDLRQRLAVQRSACAPASASARRSREVPIAHLAGRRLSIDGFNLLTTIEAALAGAVVLRGMDGCLRDLAGLSGTWKHVAETALAIERIGACLAAAAVAECFWYLDQPVGNSGRLRRMLEAHAAQSDWPWHVELVRDPDAVLRTADDVIATADSGVLDAGVSWCNVAASVVAALPGPVWLVDLARGC